MNKKLILLLLVITLGILLRIFLVGNLNSGDTQIPTNPDGLYFKRLAENNLETDNLRNGTTHEIWHNIFPTNLYFFQITAIFLFLLFGINYFSINNFLSKSIIFSSLMLFCGLIYTRTSIGFYDHDILGLAFLLGIFEIIKESKKNYLNLLFVIPFLFAIYFTWMGLFKITLFILFFILIFYLIKRLKLPEVYNYFLIIIMVIFGLLQKGVNNQFIGENNFNIFNVLAIFLVSTLFFIKKKSFLEWSLIGTSVLFAIFSIRTIYIALPITFLLIADNYKNFRKGWIVLVIILSVFLLSSTLFVQTQRFGNEDWDKGMYWIKENTPEDAIILSWWDYGYYIQYMTNRTTLSDGGYHKNDLNISYYFWTGDYRYIKHLNPDYLVVFDKDRQIGDAIINYEVKKGAFDESYLSNIQDLNISYQNKRIVIFELDN